MSFLSQPTRRFIVRASVVSALGLWIVGCSETKTSQCVKLIDVANKAVNDIEAVTAPAGSDNIEALTQIATVAERTNKEMQALNLTDPKLKEFRTRFTTMYSDTSAATRNLINAATNKDTATSQQAYESLKQSTSRESPLVDDVNRYCSSAGN
jgi:hypothetical protein